MPDARTGTPLSVARRLLPVLLAGWAVVLGIVVLSGVLLTRVLADVWPLTVEDRVPHALVALRSPLGDGATWVASRAGDTWVVIGACVVVVAVLGFLRHRWRDAVFVAACAVGQSTVFLLTTLVIDRHRPDVPKLDEAPPTSSYPSGHVGASLVLCAALALVLHRSVARPWARRALVAALMLVPVAVAFSRLYRGMHHPSDVAGSVLNAGLVLLVTAWAVSRAWPPEPGPPRSPRSPAPRAGAAATRSAHRPRTPERPPRTSRPPRSDPARPAPPPDRA